MIKSIRTILTPLLIPSYIFGLRIIEFPVGQLRLRFGFIYMLIVWSIYYLFFFISISSFMKKHYSTEYYIYSWLEMFITLLLVVFGVYHDKKFRNCLKKLEIVDDTLFKLGTMTDYNKLHKKTIWLILGWTVTVILTNCGIILYEKKQYDSDIVTNIYTIFIRNYCSHIAVINDLTIASVLGYIGLKFDQVNEQLRNLVRNNKHEIKRAWENSVFHSHQYNKFFKVSSSKCITWIIIHLHLELRKISYEMNSIFGTQMTFQMGCCFGWIALDLREIFSVIFLDDYIKYNKILYIIILISWFSYNVLKVVLINYMCETVSIKASATGDLINRISTCSVEVRENVSQFILQMAHMPLKFYGIGFFQFGFKFLRGFCISVATVLVLILQTQTNK